MGLAHGDAAEHEAERLLGGHEAAAGLALAVRARDVLIGLGGVLGKVHARTEHALQLRIALVEADPLQLLHSFWPRPVEQIELPRAGQSDDISPTLCLGEGKVVPR